MKVPSKLAVSIVALFPSLFFAAEKSNIDNKLIDLPYSSYSLQGIVDATHNPPFACSFGRYTAHVKSRENARIAVILTGKGVLMNSGWLNKNVGANPAITYLFPADAGIQDGTVVSAFCNDVGKPAEANITYYILERS